MIQSVKQKVSNYLGSKDARSQKIAKNIIISFGAKGGSILIGLLIVPLTINYINKTQYGIWLTISSIVSWMNFFDIGMGNGLRNRLAHSIAMDEYHEAKKYVSTTYGVLSIVSTLLFLILLLINPLINWNHFFNVSASSVGNLNVVLMIVFFAFCLQFVLQLLNTVLIGVHIPAYADLISFCSQFALLITILILRSTITASLSVMVSALTFIPIIVLLIASLLVYKTKLKEFAPSIKYIDFKYAKKVLNLGGAFFIIQIGALILFQTDNIIITRVLGPDNVTSFNIAYRYFSIVIMAFTILMTPLWSAFTDAYAKSDFDWIRNKIKKMRRIWMVVSFVVVPILFLLSNFVYKVWIGNAVQVTNLTSLSVAIYTIMYTGMALNSYFLNGVGKIQLQKYLYIVGCLINIPLGIWMTKILGVPGTVLSNVIILLVMLIVLWIQSEKISLNKAHGIWNK